MCLFSYTFKTRNIRRQYLCVSLFVMYTVTVHAYLNQSFKYWGQCVYKQSKNPKLQTVVNVYFRYFPYFFFLNSMM